MQREFVRGGFGETNSPLRCVCLPVVKAAIDATLRLRSPCTPPLKDIQNMIKPFLLSLFIPAFASGATIASFTTLGAYNGILPNSSGISADGSTIVGGLQGRAFRWTATGGFELLDPNHEAFDWSSGIAVSSDGSVVTGAGDVPDGSGQRAFRWTVAGGMEVLDGLEGSDGWSGGWGIAGDGNTIFGDSPHQLEDRDRAMRWSASEGMVSLGHLPGGDNSSGAFGVSADGLVGVGGVQSAAGEQAFRWTASDGMVGLGDLQTAPAPGSLRSIGYAVSGDGEVIVGHAQSDAGQQAFLWTEAAGMVGLGDIPGGPFHSSAAAASYDGSVIVGHGSGLLGQEAFIWDSEHGTRNLRDVLMSEYGLAATLADWQLQSANGISADGKTIFGSGTYQGQLAGTWVVTIPEPAAMSLLLVGGAALSARRSRTRRRAA